MLLIPSGIIFSAAIYASLIAMMCVGLTLTFMTTKVPNFAYPSFLTIGAYLTFTLYNFYGTNPYLSVLPSAIFGGLVSVAEYAFILRPLSRRGSSMLLLMVATLSLNIILTGVFGIYTDVLFFNYHVVDSKYFLITGEDFKLFGQPGILYVASIAAVAVTVSLYLFLRRTRFGTAMRATITNPSLAESLGINTERVYLFSWFLAGVMICLSGSLFLLWLPGSTSLGNDFIIPIFSGAIVGGLASIFGGIIGGALIGLAEVLGTYLISLVVGEWFLTYQPAVPVALVAVVLLLAPQGITSIKLRRRRRPGP